MTGASPPPDRCNQIPLYQEKARRKSHHEPARAGRGTECVLVKTLMGTSHSGQRGGERVNVLDLSRGQFGVTTVRCFFICFPVDAGIGFPLTGLETALT